MAYDVKLLLDEDRLLDEMIHLEGEGFDRAEGKDFELNDDYAEVMLWVHRDTGKVILVEVDRFKTKIEAAVKELRDSPLPWTFSLESLGIKEKPLEDVILAVWKKYRGMKMEWE